MNLFAYERGTECNVCCLQESVRAITWRPMLDDDADADTPTDPVEEATSKFLRQLDDHGRAPWPALLKLSRETRALEV